MNPHTLYVSPTSRVESQTSDIGHQTSNVQQSVKLTLVTKEDKSFTHLMQDYFTMDEVDCFLSGSAINNNCSSN